MDFPGKDRISNPLVDLRYEIDILAPPEDIWPWIKQLGYHRGGWYIDTWWDEFSQKYFWPLLVPKNARPTFKPPADDILPEFQILEEGDIVPDGPPGSAYYNVIKIRDNQLVLLYATTHFNYMAPQFVYQTKFAPKGAFCWAFIIKKKNDNETQLISWWQSNAHPRKVFMLLKPVFIVIDGAHQRAILKGIKKRVEKKIAT
jgi:hypothetical protein